MTTTYRTTTASLEVDPISRIEGHLGIQVKLTAGVISSAKAHGNLFRGFENFLIGRAPNDAITFTQRICGVCPVPHGHTSTMANDHAIGYSNGYYTWNKEKMSGGKGITKAALYVRNLVLASEFLMSSITHFYHLAAPSYIQGPAVPPWTPYFNDGHYHASMISKNHGVAVGPYTTDSRGVVPAKAKGFSKALWDTVIRSYVRALRVRRLTFEAGALFAGRMPMTSCYTAGGVTNYWSTATDLEDRCDKFNTIMQEVGDFIVREYVPIVLVLGALYPNYDNQANASLLKSASSTLWTAGNFASTAATSTANTGWGAGLGRYLSWGAFPLTSGSLTLPGGYFDGTSVESICATVGDVTTTGKGTDAIGKYLREWISSSRYTYHQENYPRTGASTVTVSASIAKPDVLNLSASTSIDTDSIVVKPSSTSATTYVAGRDYTIANTTMSATKTTITAKAGGVMKTTGTVYVSYKWAKVGASYAYPGDADRTKPVKSNGYTWLKAPRWKNQSVEVGPLARLVVGGLYPRSSTLAATVPGYTSYTKTASGTTGLHPSMVAADVAVALVREGLATLKVGSTVYTSTDVNPTSGTNADVITALYTNKDAVICGIAKDWIIGIKGGKSVMDRLRARGLESLVLVQKMIGSVSYTGATYATSLTWGSGWIDSLKALSASRDTYVHKATPSTLSSGIGVTEAPRGALAHFVTIESGKIKAYQCVVPTTWNGSPTVTTPAGSTLGAIESACVGVPYADLKSNSLGLGATVEAKPTGATVVYGGVEALRCAQSFDPCIACAVH